MLPLQLPPLQLVVPICAQLAPLVGEAKQSMRLRLLSGSAPLPAK
jgi:hypothetical protein